MACCTHRVRRILLLVEEWEGTFFKPSQRTTNTLQGSFHRKCGRRFQHSLESKAGEDSEWRAFSSTLSTQRVDRTFLQEWGAPLGPFKELRLLPPLSSDSWGHYPGLPPRQFGRSLLDGEGSLALSHNVEGFSEKTMGSFPTQNEMV